MIRNSLKKAVSVVMTGALLFGLAGCLNFGGGKKAVIEAAGYKVLSAESEPYEKKGLSAIFKK